MARFFKITGIVATVLVGLIILMVVIVNLIPGEYYKTLIGSGVRSATGRELAIKGDLDIKLSTTFAFKASGIKFSNAEWGSRPHMVSVGNIVGELALFPLLRGILEVALVVDKPELFLETNTAGQGNWQFKDLAEDVKIAEEEAGGGGGPPLRPLIRKLHLNGIRIAFLDGKSGDKIDFQSETLHIGSAKNQLAIDLKGKFNDIPLALSGGFDNAGIFIENQPTNVRLDGHFGAAKLVVQGTAGPLAPTFDMDVTVAVDTDSMTAFSPLAGRDLSDLGPLSVSVNLTGKEGKYAISDLLTTLNAEKLSVEVKGSVADLTALSGLNLEAKVNTGHLTEVLKAVGFESQYPLPDLLNVNVMVEGSMKELAVKQFQAEIQGQGLKITGSGEIKNIISLEGVKADLSLEIESLDLIEEIVKTDLPPFGSLKVTANVVSKGENLGLMEIKADLNGEIIHADVAGSIDDVLKIKTMNIVVNLGIDSLAWLPDYIKTELPPLGSLNFSASITSEGKTFETKKFNANLNGENITAKVTGAVGDLLKVQGIDAKVDLGVQSLAFVSDYVQMELPPLGSLIASANIASKGDTFEIRDLKADLAGKGIHTNVAGSVGDLLKLKEINTDVNLEVASLDLLSEYVGAKLPPLGPLSASASIGSKGETFEVTNIKVDLAGEKIQAKVAGSVEDLLKLTGINANINFAVDSLASLDPLVKQELPASGPVTLEGKISSKGGLVSPISIATVVKSDGVTVNLTGSIAEPLAAKGIDLALTLEADSMQKVGKLTGVQFQGKKPVKLKGKFIAGENTYELAGLHLQVAELDVKGQAAFKQPSEPGDRPRVSGKLHIGALDLSKRQIKADTSANTESSPQSKEEEVKKDKIFSSEPLPFGPLRSVDADIEVTLESLTTLQLQFEDLVAGLTLDNGLLSLKPIKFKVGNGTFDGDVTLDTRNKPASLTADVEMTDGTFRNFGGKIHFLADIDGSGDSIAAIMAGLNGLLELDVHDATLKKSFMTGFGSGMLDSLNPFNKGKEEIELICAIILFDIEDGVADAKHKIAAQMTDVTWFGSGEINLKTEAIDFGMNPKARKGLGISLGNLAKMVQIGGTLAEPKIVLDPKELAVKYGKYSLGVATGGLTWVAELLWGKIKANTDVCDKILENLDSKEAPEEKKSE